MLQQLFCDLQVDPVALSRAGVDFARELGELDALCRDGLLDRQGPLFKVTPLGRLLLRNIAAVFDDYLREPNVPRLHSAAV